MKVNSTERRASLSTSSNSSEDRSLESNFKVGIWHDNSSVVTTELKNSLSKASMHISADSTSNSSRSSEGYERDSWVLNHRVSDVSSVASDHRNDTVEAMSLQDVNHHLTEGNSDKGDRLGTLPDDLVTNDECEGSVPSHDSDWEVESSDDTDVTNWVPKLHHVMTWSLRVENFTINSS